VTVHSARIAMPVRVGVRKSGLISDVDLTPSFGMPWIGGAGF
jgi:hypothetical protein